MRALKDDLSIKKCINRGNQNISRGVTIVKYLLRNSEFC